MSDAAIRSPRVYALASVPGCVSPLVEVSDFVGERGTGRSEKYSTCVTVARGILFAVQNYMIDWMNVDGMVRGAMDSTTFCVGGGQRARWGWVILTYVIDGRSRGGRVTMVTPGCAVGCNPK